VGSVYLPGAGAKLPDEPRRLALVLTGRRGSEFWGDGAGNPPPALDFFDLKGILEALTDALHLAEAAYRPSSAPYLHPGRAADLLLQGQPVGSFGQLHPRVAEAFEMGGRAMLACELDLEAILERVPARYDYTPVPRFPAALRDIALVLDETISAERVVTEIRAAGGGLLRGLRLFDVYRGESIPAGKKSLAYALTYQADDRTLTDKEVDKAHKKIADRLKHVLKAQIRGEEG
jgi:phenylalanyl-tRNA synthetase beta chain